MVKMRKAREIRIQVHGELHVSVAKVSMALGLLSQNRNDFKTALEMYQCALKIFSAAYGEKNANVAAACGSVGGLLSLVSHKRICTHRSNALQTGRAVVLFRKLGAISEHLHSSAQHGIPCRRCQNSAGNGQRSRRSPRVHPVHRLFRTVKDCFCRGVWAESPAGRWHHGFPEAVGTVFGGRKKGGNNICTVMIAMRKSFLCVLI